VKKYFFVSFLYLAIPLRAASSVQSGFIESSDHIKIYYEKSGAGEPLFLIAGGPGDSHSYFKSYFDSLEKIFTVIYYDARGRGRSGRTSLPGLYTVDKDVEDLENLRLKLGYDKIHVFGHSYGGMVAARYATHYPSHLSRLVLCNTFHSAGGWQNNIDNCNRHIQESFPEAWKQLMSMRRSQKSSTSEWRRVYDPCIETLYWYSVAKMKKHQKHYEEIRTEYDAFADTVYYAIIGNDPDFEVSGAMKELDLRDDLKKINTPTLVLGGRGDKIATAKQAAEIQELIPNSKLHIFEESGHLPFIEENKAFVRLVSKFLKNEKDPN